MTNNETKVVDSTLSVKAVGSISDISADLQLPQGQSISELIQANEKEKEDSKTE